MLDGQDRRTRPLERRLILKARAYKNADNQTRQMRLGRVDGYLGVGVAFGYWSRRQANRMYDAILRRQGVPGGPRRIRFKDAILLVEREGSKMAGETAGAGPDTQAQPLTPART